MNGTTALEWVVALGVGAVVAEVVRSMLQRRKMGADAAKVITDAATVLLGPLHDRIKELEVVVADTRRELDAAREQVMLATGELHEARNEVAALRARIKAQGLDLDAEEERRP